MAPQVLPTRAVRLGDGDVVLTTDYNEMIAQVRAKRSSGSQCP